MEVSKLRLTNLSLNKRGKMRKWLIVFEFDHSFSFNSAGTLSSEFGASTNTSLLLCDTGIT